MMRFPILAAMAVLCLAGPGLVGPAWAVDSGLEVQVNPVSAAGGTLLYPGGQYLRLVPSLRQPGDTGGPVVLHLPRKGARTASAAPPSAPRPAAPRYAEPPLLAKPSRPAKAPRVAEVPKPAPAPKKVASAPRAAEAAPPAAFGAGPGAAGLFGALPSAAPAPATQLASAAPTPGDTQGLAKQGVILFSHEADAPADSAIDAIRLLATQLNNVMTRPQSRIELMAFGGNKGDKGSDARRLSLKRALSIRQVLIDSGVSSTRIDVHAEGGVDDTGPADRVDVYVKA